MSENLFLSNLRKRKVMSSVVPTARLLERKPLFNPEIEEER
jgi:hypothetical protein